MRLHRGSADDVQQGMEGTADGLLDTRCQPLSNSVLLRERTYSLIERGLCHSTIHIIGHWLSSSSNSSDESQDVSPDNLSTDNLATSQQLLLCSGLQPLAAVGLLCHGLKALPDP